jgi:thioesterase domain-containing protein
LDGRTTPTTDIADMAAGYMKEIKETQPRGPYIIGGYCMGGTVAIEVARQLSSQGERVGLVALLETYNVKNGPARPTIMFRLALLIQNLYFHICNLLVAGVSSGGLKFLFTKSRTAWRRLISRQRFLLQRWYEIDHEAYPHKLITKINDAAQMHHEPYTYDGKVVLFRPNRWFLWLNAPDFGWRGILKSLEIVELPVHPRGMLVAPFVSQLAKELESRLEIVESE